MISGPRFRFLLAIPVILMLAAPLRPFGRVANPEPSITSLAPAALTAGAPAQTVTITGQNFLSTSSVTFNGTSHKAVFRGAGRLAFTLRAEELKQPGSYPIVVTNPPPGGGVSEPARLVIRPAHAAE